MYLKLKQFVKKSDFVKNSFLLASGTTIAQFFPLLIYPILGRIYTAEQFGFLASFTAIVAILAVISTGKYEMSILIAKTDEEAANILVLSLLLSIIVLTISLLPLFLFKNYIDNYFKFEISFKWIILFPLSAFCINVFNCYNEWCVRRKYYRLLSLNKITNSASVSGSKLLFGFVDISSQGLTIGDIFGRIITAVICITRLLKKELNLFKKASLKGIICQAKRFKEFPLYTMPAQLLNTLGSSLPILLVGIFYNKELGYYSMTTSVVALPISVVSVAIRDVFRQKANEDFQRYGAFDKLFIKLLKYLSIISIAVALIVFFFLPKMFGFVLGEKWITSGYYTQILMPMIIVDFIAMSLSGVLTITEKLKQTLIWQICFVSVSVLSILLGGLLSKKIETTLYFFTFARLIAYLYLIILSYYYSKGNEKR